MSEINRLVVAWVSAQQRHFHNSTRGIATAEQRITWEQEAEQIIAAHDHDIRADERRRVAAELFNEAEQSAKIARQNDLDEGYWDGKGTSSPTEVKWYQMGNWAKDTVERGGQ